jgi:hypothetical protein
MILAERRLAIPSNAEYSVPQLRMMIREVEAILRREIASDEWERLVAGTWISLGLWDGPRIRQRPKWGKMPHSWHFFDLRPVIFWPLTPLFSMN